MKTQPTPSHGYHRTSLNSLMRIAAFVALVALIGIPLFSSSLASSTSESSRALPIPRSVSDKSAAFNSNIFGSFLNVGKQPALMPLSPAFAETIATFAADCTTPRSAFLLGETVCAKTDNVTETNRFVNWCVACPTIAFGGAGVTDIIPANQPQNFLYTPTVTGTWKATIADPSDSSIIPAVFTVSSTTLATYKSGCMQAESSFSIGVGNIVCARVTGVDPALNRRLFWIDPAGNLRQATAITTDPQTDSFTLPPNDTSIIGNDVVDNRGTWKVNIVSSRGSAVFSVLFNVAGATPTADLGVAKAIIGASPDAGANFTFFVAVKNNGPSDAANVVFTDPQPVNATFVPPVVQTSGPTSPSFSCVGSNPVVCTRASLAVGETATFEITYTAGSSGTITNTATVSSDTAELNPADNTGSYGPITINAGGGEDSSCTLDCPADIVVTATSPSGAVVDFSEGFVVAGNCGTISTTPASGSLFPVGTTLVTAMSSVGGGTCTFHVTVVNSAAPTIACPLTTLTANAPNGQTETAVAVSTPAATGTCVQVVGSRDDDAAVNDPYPVGTTVITWTATEILGNCPPTLPAGTPGRTASCSQIVIVSSGDAPTITCPSNKTFTVANCTGYTATAAEIGTPTTTGNLATPDPGETNPAAVRSDHLPLLNPYPVGTTVITWTATDTVGRVVSCSQNITVNSTGDHTPPTFTTPLPPDLNVTTTTCSALLDDELGVVEATDTCSTVNIKRTGVPLTVCILPNICPIDCSAQFGPGKTCNENFNFPVGTTNVVYTATDAAGNQATFTQHVTVHEPTPPVFTTFPSNVGPVNNDPGLCSAVVSDLTLGPLPTVADNCDTTVIRSGVPAGNIFPVGQTTITYTAKADITVTTTQIVTVVDNTPPTITAPADSSAFADANCQAPVPDYRPGTTAADNCGSVTLSQSPAPGTLVGFGPHNVVVTADDGHGNTANDTVVFTVNDNTPPTINAPDGSSAFADANCQAPVPDYRPGTTAADNCGSVTLSQNPAPGTLVGFGPHNVVVTADDGHGNTNSDTAVFTVNDNTPPVFTSCPSNITLEPTCPTGAIATWAEPTATDNCGVTVTRTPLLPANGAVFPIGTTTLTYTADDGHGNTKPTCTFTVTVKTVFQTIEDLKTAINSSSLNGTQKQGLIAKLQAAEDALAIGHTNTACQKLADFINSTQNYIDHGNITAAVGNAWISTAAHVRNTIGCTNNPCT